MAKNAGLELFSLSMSNTEIRRLVEGSHLHEEDAREILRIFDVMTEKRQIEILSDWPRIAENIKRSREALEEEKRLLLESAIAKIEEDLEAYNRSLVWHQTENELDYFKTQI